MYMLRFGDKKLLQFALLQRFGIALLTNLLALALTTGLQPLLQDTRFLFFYPAVIITAYFSGFLLSFLTTIFGVLSVWYFSYPPAFSFEASADQFLVMLIFVSIATTLNIIIQDLRRSQQVAQQAATRTEQLQRITAAFSAAQTPAEIAQIVIEQSATRLGAALGTLRLLTPDNQYLKEVFVAGDEIRLPWNTIPMSASYPLTDAVRMRKPICFASREAFIARYPHLEPEVMSHPFHATASLPVLLEDRALGAISLSYRELRPFSPEEQSFLIAVAQQCALAIERSRLYEAEQQARLEAEAAVQYRDYFLSLAAHELRTPLTSLLSNAQLVHMRLGRTADLSARDERALRMIASQARRLDALIQTLFDISRLELGQLTIERSSFDIATLIRRLVDELHVSQEERRIELDIPGGAILVNGDELRLEQVFVNLVQNALKYSPADSPVRIDVRTSDAVVRVSVTDFGIGIPSQDLPHLFERFYRAGNVDQQSVGGMGIGLWLVSEVVHLHGGQITVQSSEGHGSTFTVTLPLAQESSLTLDLAKPDKQSSPFTS
jgi:hypothetical protein